jgi:hypothetical protein
MYREIHGARRNTQLDGNGECSANASDTNWCGPYYSNDAIERGDYKNEEVGKLFTRSSALANR